VQVGRRGGVEPLREEPLRELPRLAPVAAEERPHVELQCRAEAHHLGGAPRPFELGAALRVGHHRRVPLELQPEDDLRQRRHGGCEGKLDEHVAGPLPDRPRLAPRHPGQEGVVEEVLRIGVEPQRHPFAGEQVA